MTLQQSSSVHIQALVSADGILLGSNSKLQFLVINLASVPGGQLVNSPTAQSLKRYRQCSDSSSAQTMNKLLGFLILLFLLSCKTKKPDSGINLLDFESFTIETPTSWTKIESKGVDSYVGGIQIDSSQEAGFDLGLYSNDLSEFVKVNLHDTTYAFVTTSKFPPLMGDSNYMEKIKKCKVIWDTIDGYRAKLVIPINTGFGVTGIYIDSLWQTQSGNVKFELSGNNLSPENEMKLVKAFKTLRFHRKT